MTTPKFEFDMRQMVRTPGKKLPGTVIGRAEVLSGDKPLYLVRSFHSTSRTKGKAYPESALRAY